MKPVRRLAIKRLVKLSKGEFSQQMVDDLVARAAAGDVPAGTQRRPWHRGRRDGRLGRRIAPESSAPNGSSASTRAASPARRSS